MRVFGAPLIATLAALLAFAPSPRAEDEFPCKNHYILRCELPLLVQWLPAPPMLLEHGDGLSTATLADGRVLVTGGDWSDGGAEVYDPIARAWSVVPRMNVKRSHHRSVGLRDGRVLVVGGDRQHTPYDDIGTAEIFDPVAGTWTPTPPLQVARRTWSNDLTATLLGDGAVLVTGGNDARWGAIAQAEIYDPARGGWQPTGSLAKARVGHTATLLADGKVLVVGGVTDEDFFEHVASAEHYDPGRGTWQVLGAAPKIANHTATTLADGRILIAGGQAPAPVYGDGVPQGATWPYESTERSWLFDPMTRGWSEAGRLGTARHGHFAIPLDTGDVLAAAGRAAHMPVLYQASLVSVRGGERFDAAAATWSPVEEIGSAPEYPQSATRLADGTVLVIGAADTALLRYGRNKRALPRISR
jgi:hypothetical protein